MQAEEQGKRVTIAVMNVRLKRDVTLYVEWAEINEIDILAVVEANKETYCEQDLSIFRDGEDGRSVAVILVDKNLRVKFPRLARGHAVLKLIGTGIMIHFWYVPPAPAGQEQFREMEVLFAKRGRGIIHTGDINATTSQKGKTSQDAYLRGKKINDVVSKGNLVVVNDPEATTYATDWNNVETKTTSCLDWTLASPDLVDRIKWEAVPPMYTSDHAFIIIELGGKVPRKKLDQHERLAPAAFLRSITESTSDGDTSKWLDHYQAAIDVARKAYRKRKSETPNDYLKMLKERMDKLTKMVRRGDGVYTEKQKELRELSMTYRIAKEEWKKKVEIEKRRGVSNWKELKGLPNTSRDKGRVDRVVHDNETLTGAEACTILLEKFFASTENELVELPADLPGDDEPLTSNEIETAIKTFKKNKAPGLSGVSTDLIKQWYNKSPQYINELLTEWFQDGAFPEELKTMLIIGLVKDKTKKQTKENARPVALTDALGKVYEKVIDTRLMFHVEKANILSPKQYGFRKNRNVFDALDELEEFNEVNKNRYKLVLQTDVRSAFDAISQKAIVDTLIDKKLPGNIIKVIFKFMRERTAVMTLAGETVSRTVCKGVPQGSCLGPHLYIITANMVLEKLEGTLRSIPGANRARVIAFADDVVVATAADEIDTASSQLRKAAECMSEALTRIGLEMASGKLRALKDVDTEADHLQWGDVRIPLVETAKVLGVTFSSDRKFDEHLKEVERKMNEWLRNNEKLINTWKGLNSDMTSRLIKQVLLPKLTYGAAIWNSRFGDNRRVKAMKERITRATSIAMIGAPKETGKTAAALLTKSIPFHIKCDQIRLEKEMKTRLQKQKRKVEVNTSVVELGHPAKRLREKIEGTLHADSEVNELEADLIYFTDGSRYDHEDQVVVGAAYVRMERETDTGSLRATFTKKFKLKPENSVFQAETLAIGQALMNANEFQGNKTILVLSDSLSAIHAVSSAEPESRLVMTCKNVIRKIRAKGMQVSIRHVKAHVNITGNELADKEAKDAALDGIEVEVPLPISTIKQRAREKAKKTYQEWYEKSADGREIKKYFSGPSDERLKLAEVNWSTIPLYAGHGMNLSSMKYGFKGAHENCRCGAEQTMQHLLFDCECMMEKNVETALQVGMSLSEFFEQWSVKVNNKKIHKYIGLRAKSIHKEIKLLNKSYIEIDNLSRELYLKLGMRDENDGHQAMGHESNQGNVRVKNDEAPTINPRLTTGVAMTQWCLPGRWTDGTVEGEEERWTPEENNQAEAAKYERIEMDGRTWYVESEEEEEGERW